MKKKTKIRIALISLICIVALPVTAFMILSWGILPPEKLTPLVVNIANKYLNAQFQCDQIELTYFETFPYMGIAITNGNIVSYVAADSLLAVELQGKTDSLISFSKCTVSLDPILYLSDGKIGIKDIIVENPRIFGFVNSQGKANWEITMEASDSTSTESAESAMPPIDIKQIRIRNGNITYYNSVQQLYTHVESFFLTLDGAITHRGNELDIETGWKAFKYLSADYSLENKLELHASSKLKLSDNYKRVTFSDTELLINKLPFMLSGDVYTNDSTQNMELNLDYGLKVPDLNSLLAFIPSAFLNKDSGLKATGKIDLSGSIRGELGDSVYPVLTACCILEDGSLHGKDKNQGIDSLSMDLDLHLDMANSDSSFIDLSRMFIKGKLSSFNMKSKVTDILKNPNVTASMKGNINFTELSKLLVSPDTLLANGVINMDIETRFKASDIQRANYGKIYASGQMSIDSFKAVSKPFDILMIINRAKLSLDSETKLDKFMEGQKLLSGKLEVDSLNVKWKEDVLTVLSHLKVAITTPPSMDTTAIVPMGGIISFNHLRTLLPDSAWIRAGKTNIKGAIKPSALNKKKAELVSVISMDSLAYIYPQYKSALLLTKSEFTMKAFPYQPDSAALLKRKLAMALQGDSVTRRTAQMQRDSSVMLSGSTSSVLRKWDVKGNVIFSELKAFTPMFPVKIGMQGTNVKFTTNDIKLSGAQLMLGKSDLTLSGEITSLRSTLLRGRQLTANLTVNSNYIDCNELMNALSSGMLYSEQLDMKAAANEPVDGFVNFETAAKSIGNTVNENVDTTGVFVLPKFLNLTLQTNVKEIDFNDLNLENVKGEVVLRDQNIQLTNLTMHSNIGCGSLTMVYSAKDKRKASTGFDLKMDEIQVNKLIDLFPAMDSLMPMLRSFEGVVDCQIAATCDMDSTMSILLPSLYSACYLHGKNMVLLDGETFTEISKTLMFKNKKRNIIDNISVDLVVHENKIEVFPFLVEIDRYRVAVGGTHNLDMTFNYHISVLKSPVPFKLGIDVTGNLDDFDYKITKCKYKDIFKPAKSTQVDTTTLNIRKNIYESIHKRIFTSLYKMPEIMADSLGIHHQHPDMAAISDTLKHEEPALIHENE